jgi:hypothetical protein
VKCSAPEYIDYAMTFIQKTISNEDIFPTRLGKYLFIYLFISKNEKFR